MKKTLICLYATHGKGKTQSIRKVHELLGGDLGVRADSTDIMDVIMHGNVKIGIESTGDPESSQKNDLERLMKDEQCDIIVGASRTRGTTPMQPLFYPDNMVTASFGFHRFMGMNL